MGHTEQSGRVRHSTSTKPRCCGCSCLQLHVQGREQSESQFLHLSGGCWSSSSPSAAWSEAAPPAAPPLLAHVGPLLPATAAASGAAPPASSRPVSCCTLPSAGCDAPSGERAAMFSPPPAAEAGREAKLAKFAAGSPLGSAGRCGADAGCRCRRSVSATILADLWCLIGLTRGCQMSICSCGTRSVAPHA